MSKEKPCLKREESKENLKKNIKEEHFILVQVNKSAEPTATINQMPTNFEANEQARSPTRQTKMKKFNNFNLVDNFY